MKLTDAKFDQGMTPQKYIDQIKVNKEPFLEIYHAVEIPEAVQKQFDSLAEPLKIAAFTADWCGDAMSTTPAILRLAESTDRIIVRVFNRDDEELELTNSFLPEDRAGTVPVFIVYDSAMDEIARFIETANALVAQVDAMDEMIARELAAETAENARLVRRGKRTAFRVERARDWGEVILREFAQVVSEGLSLSAEERPAVGGTRWPPENQQQGP
jgi:thiol-disulfide isomerase/thioredoxin